MTHGYCPLGLELYDWLSLETCELKPLTHCEVLNLLGRHVQHCPACCDAYERTVKPRLTLPVDPTIPETAWVRPKSLTKTHPVSTLLLQ